ncbi:MAG TPA: HTTM domain-containing protein [Kofleriaceae bacterium]|jgi:hypothetical protein|nr:HTTM domain-containing protein [Kofleriaceae bacterium]
METDRAAKLRRAALRPIDPASLAAARILLGLLLLVLVIRFFVHGWIDEYFYAPTHFFHYLGLAWVEPWPYPGMYVHFAAMAACAVCITLGFHHRLAAAAFGLLLAYAHACDVTNYLNHYYLLVLLCGLLVVVPASATWSIDARRGRTAAATIPAWTLWLLRFQVGCVYFFGGVAKLEPSWLVDGQPLTTWLGARPDFPLLGGLFAHPDVALVASWLAAAFDLTIVGWLSWRRTRAAAYAAVIGFHVVTGMLFHLGMFPWVMVAMATLFFDPSWPRRLVPARARPAPSPSTAHRPPPRALAIALALHVALQVLIPLRSHLYPGDLLWTEQGFRFAWKVMLMEKSGNCELRALEPSTGRTWVIPPSRYYTPYQASMMATQPDLILQFAHEAAADLRRQGVRAPEVHADCVVSLHGAPRARLIDPSVDLAAVEDGLTPQPWIYPRGHVPGSHPLDNARLFGRTATK